MATLTQKKKLINWLEPISFENGTVFGTKKTEIPDEKDDKSDDDLETEESAFDEDDDLEDQEAEELYDELREQDDFMQE